MLIQLIQQLTARTYKPVHYEAMLLTLHSGRGYVLAVSRAWVWGLQCGFTGGLVEWLRSRSGSGCIVHAGCSHTYIACCPLFFLQLMIVEMGFGWCMHLSCTTTQRPRWNAVRVVTSEFGRVKGLALPLNYMALCSFLACTRIHFLFPCAHSVVHCYSVDAWVLCGGGGVEGVLLLKYGAMKPLPKWWMLEFVCRLSEARPCMKPRWMDICMLVGGMKLA